MIQCDLAEGSPYLTRANHALQQADCLLAIGTRFTIDLLGIPTVRARRTPKIRRTNYWRGNPVNVCGRTRAAVSLVAENKGRRFAGGWTERVLVHARVAGTAR